MADSDRLPTCLECRNSGQTKDYCLVCQALRGNLDPEDIPDRSLFLHGLNEVGRFRNAVDHHNETSVATKMRKARNDKGHGSHESKGAATSTTPG